MRRGERKRVRIVRYSASGAKAVIRSGGKVVSLAGGRAEVVDHLGYTRGYLTKADHKKLHSL